MPSLQAAAQRRRQHRAEARRAILDATEEILVERGFEGFSMRRLAERCGYTAPSLYHYFNDKESVIEALLEERLSALADEIRSVPRSSDLLARLRAVARAFVSFGLRNPTYYRLLALPREDTRPLKAGEEVRELLVEPFDTLAERGWLRDDPEAARQSLWALLHGLILLQTTRPDEEWVEDLADQALDAMLRGWLRPHVESDAQTEIQGDAETLARREA